MAYGSLDIEGNLRTIFRRCVQCPPGPPSCPTCAKDETCLLNAESCTECASTICVKTGSIPGQAIPKKSAPIGAIAGGVIGGVVFIVLLTFLVWRFCIRNRRRQYDEQLSSDAAVEKRDQAGLHLDARRSNGGSIASTVLTRASNVIQIAYIPGVTNRSPPESPGLLAPPVPPIPMATTNSSAGSSPHFDQDRHFFMPRDLRDSTFSGLSEDDRSSLSPSIARASVATTTYRNDAIVDPLPAQQALRAKPAVVSVKSGSASASPHTPQYSQMAAMQHPSRGLSNSNSSIVARNVVARPIEVKRSNPGPKIPTLVNLKAAPASRSPSKLSKISTVDDETSTDDDLGEGISGLARHVASLATPSSRSPVSPLANADGNSTGSSSAISPVIPEQNRLRDNPSGSTHRYRTSNGGLNNMIEDALNRAALEPTHGGLGSLPQHSKRDLSPFSDANEVKENLRLI